jgi:FMN phosphatase YigB (HAD superfamily)
MKISVKAHELETLLDRAPPTVRVLSLDCFDTLLWRGVQAPSDVFADLPIAGGGIWPRVRAEMRARQFAEQERGGTETRIEEIYRHLLPAASEEERSAAVQRELDAEARHCFGFAPVKALIRRAKERGLKVIIVSDTYLSADQLRTLIGRAAGEETAARIDRIFVSCEHGRAKGAGLFRDVLHAIGNDPSAILHVGDNRAADHDAPAELGMACEHFQQFDETTEQRIRLEAAAATMIDPQVRNTLPAHQTHRAQLSLRSQAEPAFAFGHDVMGPLMHSFAEWIRSEGEALSDKMGRRVKPLFMLRDGHLPKRVYDAAFGEDGASGAIEISRFTARRAGFIDEAAIRSYLATEPRHGRTDVLARQLGLFRDEGQKLAPGRNDTEAQPEFCRRALASATVRKIVARSAKFADRLFAHLQKVGVERGDTLMLVDLGYNGSVQNNLERVLKERFDLTLAGRYLLLREDEATGFDKRGLFDTRHYQINALHALCGPIAVVEQLSTVAQGSVVDYEPDGTPIRKGGGAKGAQNAIRDRVQDAAVGFARDAACTDHRPACDDADARRRMASGVLGRLLFMPNAEELELLRSFEHDVNLGTEDHVSLLDPEQSAEGLRRRGFFYVNNADRMFLPGELQPNGLPLNLSLFAASRFGLDLRAKDFSTAKLRLPVIVADDRTQTVIEVDAVATHDGYYAATVAVGAGRFAVGVQFGSLCDWVQIDEAAFYPVASFKTGAVRQEGIAAATQCEGMSQEGQGLYRCSPMALMMVPPPQVPANSPHILSVVFRPLVLRQSAALQKAA